MVSQLSSFLSSKNIMLSIVEKHKTSLTAQIQFTFKSKYDKDKKGKENQPAISHCARRNISSVLSL